MVFERFYLYRTSWPFVFFVPFFALIVLLRHRPAAPAFVRYARVACLVATIGLLASALVSHLLFATSNHFTNAYASVYAQQASTFAQGNDLYSKFESSFRYNLCYGPGGYLLIAGSQSLFGPSAFSSKLPIFCCWLGGLLLLYSALRTRLKWELALAATTLALAFFPHLQEFEFWPRPDFPQFFFVTLGLWVVAREFRFAWLALGVLIGITVSIKINGFAFFLPLIAVMLARQPRPLYVIVALLLSIAVSFLPFLLFQRISWTTYTQLIQMTLHHDFDINLAFNTFESLVALAMLTFCAFIIFRIDAATAWRVVRKNLPYLAGLAVGLLIIGSVAVKKGAGDHHLIPFVGLFFYLGAVLYADACAERNSPGDFSPAGASLVLSECLVLYLYAAFFSFSTLSHIHPDNFVVQEHERDLEQILRSHPKQAILFNPGPVEDVGACTYGAYLVFHGMSVGVNSATEMDYNEAHLPQSMPSEVASEIAGKDSVDTLWLVPRGQEPFSEPNFFAPYGPDYSPAFVQNFHSHFQLGEQTTFFDIYKSTSQ